MPASVFDRKARWIAGAVMLAVVGGGIYIAGALTASAREDAERERLRVAFREATAAVDSCRAATAAAQESLEEDNRRLDSIRRMVRAFETAEDGGVPATEYESYLAEFDGYNDAVSAWRERADSLRARSESCRELARTQNQLADSLRRMVQRMREEAR